MDTLIVAVCVVALAALWLAIVFSSKRRGMRLPGVTEESILKTTSGFNTRVQGLPAGNDLVSYLARQVQSLVLCEDFRAAFQHGDADQGAGYRGEQLQLHVLQSSATSKEIFAALSHPFSTLAIMCELTRDVVVSGQKGPLRDVPISGSRSSSCTMQCKRSDADVTRRASGRLTYIPTCPRRGRSVLSSLLPDYQANASST